LNWCVRADIFVLFLNSEENIQYFTINDVCWKYPSVLRLLRVLHF
jgi:hypothetical protein